MNSNGRLSWAESRSRPGHYRYRRKREKNKTEANAEQEHSSAGKPVMEGGQRSCILARGPEPSIGRWRVFASHSQIESQGEAKWPNAHGRASTGSGSPADGHR